MRRRQGQEDHRRRAVVSRPCGGLGPDRRYCRGEGRRLAAPRTIRAVHVAGVRGSPVQTGNHLTNPVRWDFNVCHTYWYVYFGQGNVAQNVFEGDVPPAPPPPTDPGPFVIDRNNCQQILGMFCPKA
jgi:hypothetical protein